MDNLIELPIPASEASQGRQDNVKGVVINFSALPLVGNNIDDVYFTLQGQGVWGINRKPSDYYIWTGTEWRGTYNKLTSVTGLTFSGAEQVLSASTGAIIQAALDTKVAGPISAVDANIPTFNGTTGKLIQDSGVAITAISDNATAIANHIANTANPHDTTFTQASDADPGTDITAAEAEQLTDGSFADSLHKHFQIGNTTQTAFVEALAGNVVRAITASVVRFTIDAVGNLNLSAYQQNVRDDGTVADEKVLTTSDTGAVQLRKVLPYLEMITDRLGGINNTTTFATYLQLDFTVDEDGEYPLDWFYVWSYNAGGSDFEANVILDTNPPSAPILLSEQVQEPQDTGGGGGPSLPNLNPPPATLPAGTNQKYPCSGFTHENLVAGDYSLYIEIACGVAGNEAACHRGSLRVGHRGNV